MASVEAALAECLSYARDDRHGYELGYHGSSAMATGTDCSGLVRYYAALLAGVPTDSFPDFSTRTERSVLTGRGWSATSFSISKARRGDVLLTETRGHTVIYLGGSRILGAEGDWDGRRGDSGGREVCERDYYDYSYNWILRPPAQQAAEVEDEVTDADIRNIAHAVWNYYNAASTSSSTTSRSSWPRSGSRTPTGPPRSARRRATTSRSPRSGGTRHGACGLPVRPVQLGPLAPAPPQRARLLLGVAAA